MAAAEAGAADERAIIFSFTPTERAQIAIWIESADGMFRGTVGLTQAVSLHGIGNRPGAAQMNSGYHWPYGRREGVLPIWAHRRLSAPGAVAFPRIIFQRRPEGYASRACEDSTRDTYFCLSFSAEKAGRDQLDAVTCASVFNSDKGRIMTATDVANGYTEPAAIGGQQTDRPLERASAYPPRPRFRLLRRRVHGQCVHGRQQHLPGSSGLGDVPGRRALRDARHRRGHDGHAARRHPADSDVLGAVLLARRRIRRLRRGQHRGRLQRHLQRQRLPARRCRTTGTRGR